MADKGVASGRVGFRLDFVASAAKWHTVTSMTRLKRKGSTTTFSVSVSSEARRKLRSAANRSYGGNVSALIEAIALEADRQAALDRLLRNAPPIDETAYAAFLKEMRGNKRKGGKAA
jgi:hypothetical protein